MGTVGAALVRIAGNVNEDVFGARLAFGWQPAMISMKCMTVKTCQKDGEIYATLMNSKYIERVFDKPVV